MKKKKSPMMAFNSSYDEVEKFNVFEFEE